MTPINFSDITITPDVVERWRLASREFVQRLHDAGVDLTPGEEQLYVLDDGRLMIVCEAGPGFSLSVDAAPDEWARVSNN